MTQTKVMKQRYLSYQEIQLRQYQTLNLQTAISLSTKLVRTVSGPRLFCAFASDPTREAPPSASWSLFDDEYSGVWTSKVDHILKPLLSHLQHFPDSSLNNTMFLRFW
ncbi:hypothetical protein E2C01_005491 [Portunus trituberculatus]|uniref:Uncharacterized protein n=1 Tax=Portunus trituberculatus TaxID=210409 RepID=A0A5B7CZB0_PORTR|nr:hypothetical protein [Portunus trituberculatus]